MAEEGVGIILTAATTREAKCQLFQDYEKGEVKEGMFLQINSKIGKFLAYTTSITSNNEFYTSGDAWSEARRQQWTIPNEVARQFVVCDLQLLGMIPKLREITYPPQAGDLVTRIDVSDQLENIFDVKKEDPGIIWYGSLLGYEDAPIPLDIENITMHMAIFGTTGSGKSYDMGALLERLVDIKTPSKKISLPMLIIDANGDYLDYVDKFVEDKKLGVCPAVYRYVFPNSPDIKGHKKPQTKPIGLNLSTLEIRDLAELIVQYYTGGELNELQVSGIIRIIEEMENAGDIARGDYQAIFLRDHTFEEAIDQLNSLKEDKTIHSSTGPAIQRALEKFREIESRHRLLSANTKFSKEYIDDLTKNREIAIIDFSADGAPGVPLSVKQLIVSYLSSLLFSKFTDYKINKNERYLLFVIEECQNYVPNLGEYNVGYSLAKQKLSSIATQGRKFGLSLCLISQRPAFVDPVVLSMCNTFFIHRISHADISFVEKVCGGLPSHLKRRLTSMERGGIIVVGQMSRLPFPILINVTKRGVKHTAGTTNVIKGLEMVLKNA